MEGGNFNKQPGNTAGDNLEAQWKQFEKEHKQAARDYQSRIANEQQNKQQARQPDNLSLTQEDEDEMREAAKQAARDYQSRVAEDYNSRITQEDWNRMQKEATKANLDYQRRIADQSSPSSLSSKDTQNELVRDLDEAESQLESEAAEKIPVPEADVAVNGLTRLKESLFDYVRKKFPEQVEAVERVRQEIPKMPFYKRAAIYLGVAALVGTAAATGAFAAGTIAASFGASAFAQGALSAFGTMAGWKAGDYFTNSIGLKDKLEQVKVESSLRSTIKKAEKMLEKEKVSAEALQHVQSIEELKQINEQLLQQVETKLQKKFDRQYMLRNITQKLLTAIVAAGGSYGYYSIIDSASTGAEITQQTQPQQPQPTPEPEQPPQPAPDPSSQSGAAPTEPEANPDTHLHNSVQQPPTESVPTPSAEVISDIMHTQVNPGDKLIKILNNTFNDLFNAVDTVAKPLQTDLATLSEEIGRLLGADGNFYSSGFLSDAAKDVLSKLNLVDVDLLHPGQQLDLTKIFTHPDFVSEILNSIDANKYSDPESVKEFVKELYNTLMTQTAGGNPAQAGSGSLSV